MSKLPFTVEYPNPNVTVVRMTIATSGEERWFLLRSDAHTDSVYCDSAMEQRHLEECVERDAGIIDNGDLFDAMQGKWDPRSNADELAPQFRGNDYLDRVVRYAVDTLEPYADRIICLGHGNHETAIIKRHQTDLTERVAGALNDRTKSELRCNGYAGWVVFLVTRYTSKDSVKMYRHHGYGGGGPVTRGTIQASRMSTYTPDARVVLTGHTHDQWILPVQRDRISEMHRIYTDEQLHVRAPGYKRRSFGNGWETEKGMQPKPTGAIWLRIFRQGREMRYDAQRAL